MLCAAINGMLYPSSTGRRSHNASKYGHKMSSIVQLSRNASQRAHDVKMTSYQRRCDVMTSHRRRSDVILTPCACWELGRRRSILDDWKRHDRDRFPPHGASFDLVQNLHRDRHCSRKAVKAYTLKPHVRT